MNSNKPSSLPIWLTYAGVTPFIACTVCLLAHIRNIPIFGSTQHILSSYGLLIVTFLAGIHWGQTLVKTSTIGDMLYVTSNAVTLVAWLGYLALSPNNYWLLLAILFLLVLTIDLQLFKRHIINSRYFVMRLIATSLVCLSLVAANWLA